MRTIVLFFDYNITEHLFFCKRFFEKSRTNILFSLKSRLKAALDNFTAVFGRVYPVINMIFSIKIFDRRCWIVCREGIYNNKLYLHFLWDQTFYVDSCLLAAGDFIARFGKTGKIRGRFDKCPLRLYRANDACNRFSCGEHRGILLPGTKQFFTAKRDSA